MIALTLCIWLGIIVDAPALFFVLAGVLALLKVLLWAIEVVAKKMGDT